MIAFELRLAFAALRNLVRRPARRTLWLVALTVAFVASAIDIATASVGQRDLGGLRITPLLAVGSVAGIFALAALTGATTPRPYGTRAADMIWWRYAGIPRDRAARGTAAILIGRAGLAFGGGAIPLGVAFALATPDHGPAILAFTAAAICIATLARVVALAFTYDRDADSVRRISRSSDAPTKRACPDVPSGLAAARWIVAVRRGERLLPFTSFLWGLLVGVLLAQAAIRLNGQLVSLGAVIGPLALLLGGAVRGNTGVEELRSPWWRIALGSRPTAVCAWATSAALGLMLFLAGSAAGLGIGLGIPLAGIVAMPTCALIAPVHGLLGLAADAAFPDLLDRRGAATFARVGVMAIVIAVAVTLAWGVAPAGTATMFIVADGTLVAAAFLATHWISTRLAT